MSETTIQKFKAMLTSNGMFDNQADEVLELFKPKMEVGGYRMTWDRPASEYPLPVYAMGQMILYQTAVEWFDANLPKAWNRQAFLPPSEREAAIRNAFP